MTNDEIELPEPAGYFIESAPGKWDQSVHPVKDRQYLRNMAILSDEDPDKAGEGITPLYSADQLRAAVRAERARVRAANTSEGCVKESAESEHGDEVLELPPEGHPLHRLGQRLTELLDEHQWAECEHLLLQGWDHDRIDRKTGQHWRENSSLEVWFPFTAEELEKLRRERAQAAEPVATMHVGMFGSTGFTGLDAGAKLPEGDYQLYTTPARPAVTDLLSADDMRWLRRFQEICEDSGADGHDVPKAAMRNLEQIGVVRSCGFGRHETTAFGDYILEAALGGGDADQA